MGAVKTHTLGTEWDLMPVEELEGVNEAWNSICCAVRDEVAEYAYRAATPLSLSEDLEHASALGTGNYVKFGSTSYLLTNEHVASKVPEAHLAHLPGPSDDYVACNNPIQAVGWPIDVALMRLDIEPHGNGRETVPVSRLDRVYSPVQNELMFWLGFPGSKASRHEAITERNIRHTWFGQLETPACPILVQEAPIPTTDVRGFDAEKHVALHYPSAAIRRAGAVPEDTPNPGGMSGSFLWDTKFLACAATQKTWSVEEARVCGVVWGAHEKPEIVVATKIEHVLPLLVLFLRKECAYFRWIARGRPLWDALEDWVWAERRIANLYTLAEG